jgi:hypothetical protein
MRLRAVRHPYQFDEAGKLADPADFSLVLGGPLYQLLVRLRMLKPPLELYSRRIIAITLIAWLPLLLLTMLAGQAIGGVDVPFFFDLDAHARFVGSIPLLIAAELIVHRRMKAIVGQFIERGIVTPDERARFEDIISSVMRLRNSVMAELLLVVFVFSGGHWIWREQISLDITTWYATQIEGQPQLTSAGYWYAYVSLPIVRFIGLRWWFRWFLWCLFLFRVSRLRLNLNALHPDRAGGLGFLAGSMFAFSPVLIAHTLLLAGVIGNQIWHTGAALPDFKLEIATLVGLLLVLTLAPLALFFFHLDELKRRGMREFGMVASRYVNDFRRKWIEEGAEQEAVLGTGDIQSLADLSSSFDVAREMRLLPFDMRSVVELAVLAALPLLPLALTIIPLEEMIERLAGVLF